ncbi:MAG: DUF3307 domain-containing protein [Bacteroidales bacterium]|jgi:hypothetical protein|nr:DUF3307 domain-containing protein [Bacteroidales bacterium]
MITIFLLLFALNLAHFLGDFTPLNKWFISAKQYGKPVWLVACHGALNGALYGITVGLFILSLKYLFFAPFAVNLCTFAVKKLLEHPLKMILIVFTIETVTHTLIDILKGRINRRFPVVQNSEKSTHWVVMGADQFLHQVVLIGILFLSIKL